MCVDQKQLSINSFIYYNLKVLVLSHWTLMDSGSMEACHEQS